MTYELAKELNDAGFDNWRVGKEYPMVLKINHEPMYEPGLEELIEACGDGIFNLMRTVEDTWEATKQITPTGIKITITVGPTAIVAVARLWLALNKVAGE